MPDVFQYYGRFQNVRGQLGTLPAWARSIVMVFALPGILLAVLSILLFLVSILALFLLTAPVYRLLQVVTGGGRSISPVQSPMASPMAGAAPGEGIWSNPGESPGRKSVQVRVVE